MMQRDIYEIDAIVGAANELEHEREQSGLPSGDPLAFADAARSLGYSVREIAGGVIVADFCMHPVSPGSVCSWCQKGTPGATR